MLRAGEIVQIGKPSELTASFGRADPLPARGEQVVLETDDPTRALHELTARALAEGFELEELEVRRATLEDVYLDLVAEEGHVKLFWHQLRAEQLTFWRSREAAIFVFLFPPLLFVLLASVFGDGIEDGRRSRRYLVAGLIGYAVANTGARRPRDHAGDPARVRDPEAAPLDPAPGQPLPRRRRSSRSMLDLRAPVA